MLRVTDDVKRSPCAGCLARDEEFGDLDGVEGRTLAQVVIAHEHREATTIRHALIRAHAADEGFAFGARAVVHAGPRDPFHLAVLRAKPPHPPRE